MIAQVPRTKPYRKRHLHKKILTVWCSFLDSPDSPYGLNDSPSGWKCEAT